MKEDATYKERFAIKTPIRYMHDVEVDPKVKDQFDRYYKKFLDENEIITSKSRRKQFDSFLKRLAKHGDDLLYTGRIEIRYISKQVGFGVFAKQDIAPYSLLNHYAGILTTDKNIDSDNDSTFMFSDVKKFSIDAAKQGNWCRFMNHSPDGDKNTNVIAWEHYSQWGPRIIFTAGPKGIKKGAQLLYSYGDEYWEEGKFTKF